MIYQFPNSYDLELPICLPPCVSALRTKEIHPCHNLIHIYLKAQNSSWKTERVLCFRDQVFPLLFPIHTSKPASARTKPRLLLGRFMIQLLESASKPCCRNTTGLGPKKNIHVYELAAPSFKINLILCSTNNIEKIPKEIIKQKQIKIYEKFLAKCLNGQHIWLSYLSGLSLSSINNC